MSNMKDTKGKAKLRLIPYDALVRASKVREFGIAKYGDDNGWLKVDKDDFLEAALRHIYKYFSGHQFDEESGLPHIDHALCSLILAVAKDEILQFDDEDDLELEIILDDDEY